MKNTIQKSGKTRTALVGPGSRNTSFRGLQSQNPGIQQLEKLIEMDSAMLGAAYQLMKKEIKEKRDRLPTVTDSAENTAKAIVAEQKKEPTKRELQEIADRWLGASKAALKDTNTSIENEHVRAKQIRLFVSGEAKEQETPEPISYQPFEDVESTIILGAQKLDSLAKKHKSESLTAAVDTILGRATEIEQKYPTLISLSMRNNRKIATLDVIDAINEGMNAYEEEVSRITAENLSLASAVEEQELEFEIRQGDIGELAKRTSELQKSFRIAAKRLNKAILEPMGVAFDDKGDIVLIEPEIPQIPEILTDEEPQEDDISAAKSSFNGNFSLWNQLVEYYKHADRDETEEELYNRLTETAMQPTIIKLALLYTKNKHDRECLQTLIDLNAQAEEHAHDLIAQRDLMESVIQTAGLN